MKTSQAGIDLIKRFEGLELESYLDIADVWTIGYGHTGPEVGPDQRITANEAEALLRHDLVSREKAVSRLTRVSLNQNEFDALVSFVYNVGIGAYERSTARRRLNNGDRLGAGDALTWWNKATVNGVLRPVRGLTVRRTAEKALFLTPMDILSARPEDLNENARITPVEEPPRRGSISDSRTIQGATVAGGAGVAATNMGRDASEELDVMETEIASGDPMTASHSHDDDDETSDDSHDDDSHDSHDSDSHDDTHNDENDTTHDDIDEAGHDESHDDDEDVTDIPDLDGDESADGDVDAGDEPSVSGDDEIDSPLEDDGDGLSVPTLEDEDIIFREEDDTGLGTSVEVDSLPPAKHKRHESDAQIQLALMIIIVLAVAYIFFARIDDWFRFRR